MDPVVLRRILAAANFEEPDQVPIWDFIDSWPIYQEFAPGETDPVRATAAVFNGLGIDMCRSVYMPVPLGRECGEDDAQEHGATRWAGRPITSLDDLRAYEVPPSTEQQAWEWVKAYVDARAVFAPRTLYVPCDGVGFHASYGLMGIEMFSYALVDAFDDAARLVDAHFRPALLRAQVFAQTSACPLFMYGDDIAYKGRAMFSPAVMRRLFYPYLEELCSVLAGAGVKVIFHTDGYVMDIVADLVACGIAGLNPLEPLAGNDIPELKRRYGDRLILVGGIDCSQTLPLGSVDDVRLAVRDLLATCGRGGGLFIGSSSEIVPVTPVENIHAFYDACREFGQYPLRPS